MYFLVGQNLQLEVRKSTRKASIVRVIAEHLVDNDVFEEETLSQLQVDIQDLTPNQLELEKAKIKIAARAEIEKA